MSLSLRALESAAGPRRPARGSVATSRQAVWRDERTSPRLRLPRQHRAPWHRIRDRADGPDFRPVGPQRLLVPHGVRLPHGRVRHRPRGAQLEPARVVRRVPLREQMRWRGARSDRPPTPRRRPPQGDLEPQQPGRGSAGPSCRDAVSRTDDRGARRPRVRARAPPAADDRRRLGRRRRVPPVEQARDHRRARHADQLGACRSTSTSATPAHRGSRSRPSPSPKASKRGRRPRRRSTADARREPMPTGRCRSTSSAGCST